MVTRMLYRSLLVGFLGVVVSSCSGNADNEGMEEVVDAEAGSEAVEQDSEVEQALSDIEAEQATSNNPDQIASDAVEGVEDSQNEATLEESFEEPSPEVNDAVAESSDDIITEESAAAVEDIEGSADSIADDKSITAGEEENNAGFGDEIVADTSDKDIAKEGGSASNELLEVSRPKEPILPNETSLSSTDYIAQPGDTLGHIARIIFGDSSQWRTLAEHNSLTNPDSIHPGDVIRFPVNEKTQAFADKMANRTVKTIIVKSGNTLSGLAQEIFGSASAWQYLWRFNASAVPNPNAISVGQTLSFAEMLGSKKVAAKLEEETSTEEASH